MIERRLFFLGTHRSRGIAFYCRRFGLLFLVISGLVSCSNVDLYSALPEQEANQMLALLIQNDVDASKETNKQGTTISIPKHKVPLAVDLLYAAGYPKTKFTNVNEVFSDSGLVTSEFEQKIRFNYALSQEIADTISKIDGVIYVSVHLPIPEENKNVVSLGEKEAVKAKTSASIFIKYNPNYNLNSEISQIKLLVANSVNNLNYQDVSVSLSPSKNKNIVQLYAADLRIINGLDLKMDADSVLRFYVFVAVLVCIILVLLFLSLFFYRKFKMSGITSPMMMDDS